MPCTPIFYPLVITETYRIKLFIFFGRFLASKEYEAKLFSSQEFDNVAQQQPFFFSFILGLAGLPLHKTFLSRLVDY